MQGLAVFGFGLALCAATAAGAQQVGSANEDRDAPLAVDRQLHACVDPADATARPRLQREPCRLPMYRLPAAESPASPSRTVILPPLPERDPGHAMFWRLPIQPRGPYEAPRNSRR